MGRASKAFGVYAAAVGVAAISYAHLSPPPGAGNWEVLSVVAEGTSSYFNWVYGQNGQPEAYNFTLPWGFMKPANAYNGTDHSLTARMVSVGTIKVRLRYIGNPPNPLKVWIKVQSNASYSALSQEVTGVSGTANNGIGDPLVQAPYGGWSSGHEYYLVEVDTNGIAEQTISVNADGSYTAPYANVGADCSSGSVEVDPFIAEPERMTFSNALADIIDQNTSFGSTSGSAYPVRGWRMLEEVPEAFPVLLQKGTMPTVSLNHRLQVDWGEPTPTVDFTIGGVLQGLPNPIHIFAGQAGTASEAFVTKTFNGSMALPARIFKFIYNASWTISDVDQPFTGPMFDTGSNVAYVTWGPPLGGEVVTKKRIDWAVTAADGASTIEQAADGVWGALLGDPPVEPAYAYIEAGPPYEGHNLPNCETDSVWHLLDGTRFGECDEQARLMKAGLNLLGISATAEFVFASKTEDHNVEALDTKQVNGRLAYLFMDFDRDRSPITSRQPGNNTRWNQYEGVCKVQTGVTADNPPQPIYKVYAIWPAVSAGSMLEMLHEINPSQYYIYLTLPPKTNEQTSVLPAGWRFDGMATEAGYVDGQLIPPIPLPPLN